MSDNAGESKTQQSRQQPQQQQQLLQLQHGQSHQHQGHMQGMQHGYGGMPMGGMGMGLGVGMGMGGMGMGMMGSPSGSSPGVGGHDAHIHALMASARQMEEADAQMRRQMPQLVAGLNAKMQENQQLRALNTGLAQQVQELTEQRKILQTEQEQASKAQETFVAEIAQLRKAAEDDAAHRATISTSLKNLKRTTAQREHELLAEVAKLKPALKELDKLRSSHRRRADTEGQKMRDLKSLVAAERSKVQALEKSSEEQISQLKKQVAGAEKELQRLRSENKEAVSGMNDLSARNRHLTAQLNDQALQFETEQKQLLNTVNALEARCQGTGSKLEEVKRALGGTVAALQEDNDALQREVAELRDSRALDNEAGAEALKTTRDALTSTKEKLTVANDAIAAQKREVRELQVELQRAKTSATHTEGALRAELASTEDQLFQATEELKDTVAGQRQEIARLTEQLQQSQAATKAAKSQLEKGLGAAGEWHRERLELQQQIDEATLSIEEMRSAALATDQAHGQDLQELRNALTAAESTVASLQDQVKKLSPALKSALEQAADRQEELEACEVKIGGLVQQLHDGNTAYSKLQEEKANLQARLAIAEEESVQVVAGVTRQLKEQRQGTSAELTAARQALEQKDTELNDANLKLRELVAQEAALQQSLKTVQSELKGNSKATSAAQAAETRLRTKVELLQKSVEELRADKKKLQADYREAQKQHSAAVQKLKKERDDLRSAVKNTQRRAAEQVGEFGDKLRQLKQEQTVLLKQHEAAQVEIKALRGENSNTAVAAEARSKQLATELRTAQGEAKRLQKLLREARAEATVFEKRAIDQTAQATSLTGLLEKTNAELKHFKEQTKELQERVARTTAEKARQGELLIAQQQEALERKKRVDELEEDLARQKQRVAMVVQQGRASSKEQEEADGKVAAEMAALRRGVNERETQLAEAQKKIAWHEKRFENTKQETAKTVEHLRSQFETQEKKMAPLQKDLGQWRKRATEAESKLQRLRDTHESTQGEFKVEIAAKDREIADLKEMVTTHTTRVSELDDAIRSATARIQQLEVEVQHRGKAAAEATAAQAATEDALRQAEQTTQARVQQLEKERERLELLANSSQADLTKMHAQLEFQASEAMQEAETLRGSLEEATSKLERKKAKVKTLKMRLADSDALAEDIQSNANDTIAKLREEVRQARSQVANKQLHSKEPPKEVLGLRKKLAAVDSANTTLVKDFRALQIASIGHKEQAQLWERRYREESLAKDEAQDTIRELESKLDLARHASELLEGDAASAKLITNLRQDVAQKNARISELRSRLDSVRKEYEEQIDKMQQALEQASHTSTWKLHMQDAITSISVAASGRAGAGTSPAVRRGVGAVPADQSLAFQKTREAQLGHRNEGVQPSPAPQGPRSSMPPQQSDTGPQRGSLSSSQSPSPSERGSAREKPTKPRAAVLKQQQRQQSTPSLDGPKSSPANRTRHDSTIADNDEARNEDGGGSAAEQSIRSIQAFLENKKNRLSADVASGKRGLVVGREHSRSKRGGPSSATARRKGGARLPGIRDHLASR